MRVSVNGSKKVNIAKYYNPTGDTFFTVYSSMVDSWDNDNLSKEALVLLLQISAGIPPQTTWTVYHSQIAGNNFPDIEKFEKAFKELEEKGYAKIQDGVVYLRNDKRIEWSKIC